MLQLREGFLREWRDLLIKSFWEPLNISLLCLNAVFNSFTVWSPKASKTPKNSELLGEDIWGRLKLYLVLWTDAVLHLTETCLSVEMMPMPTQVHTKSGSPQISRARKPAGMSLHCAPEPGSMVQHSAETPGCPSLTNCCTATSEWPNWWQMQKGWEKKEGTGCTETQSQ